MNDRDLDRLVNRARIKFAIKFAIILVIVFGLLFVALRYTPPAHGEPFDWDRYHARQDACREQDRIVADCARGRDYCDELALRQATRACSPFGSEKEHR
jgi:hypothetical protein